MQLLPMAASPYGLISAWYVVITKTPGWEVLTTISQSWGGGLDQKLIGDAFIGQNSIAFGKAPRREADRQAGSQLRKQAGRRAGRNTQFSFFQWRTTTTNSGELHCYRNSQQSGGRTLAQQLAHRRLESWLAIVGMSRLTHQLCFTRPWFKSF